ncbi:MAG: DUF1573 domain-containing protein [Flavobacteriaceae bacterium]|nr:DUF1573 domain-containing protein [Flavobacteriaceae bacterium]
MKTLKLTFLAMATLLVVSCDKKSETITETGLETAEVSTAPANTNGGIEMATPVATTTNAADAPVLTLSSETYDFGDVQANSTTERIIEFTNTGNSPLVITNAKATCGCTVPEYSKEPIAPGAKGSMKVSYKAPNTNGKQTKTVTLTTNTASGSERFMITSNVVGGNSAPQPPMPIQQAPRELPAPNLGQ